MSFLKYKVLLCANLQHEAQSGTVVNIVRRAKRNLTEKTKQNKKKQINTKRCPLGSGLKEY